MSIESKIVSNKAFKINLLLKVLLLAILFKL